MKAQKLTNLIGDRGEKIFELAITDYRQFNKPLFKPGFLGEKWPTIDYYVELLGVRGSNPFFFVQVKATSASLQATSIRINATKIKCQKLFRVPGPTYIVGVHEPTRAVYIHSIHATPAQGVYNIPLKYKLTPRNLELLHKEVQDFWKSFPNKPKRSQFS